MGVILARIDNRLIHGQVLEAWVPHVHANCILVANNQVAAATFQKVLMEAAVPRGIKVHIGTIEEVARILVSRELTGKRILLLFATSGDALEAHRQGIDFSDLNLGNMHAGDGKLRYSCTIALDEADIDNLESLEKEGVRIVSQCIPSDREQSWRRLIQSAGK